MILGVGPERIGADQRRHIRVFLSSPGDVAIERKAACELIKDAQSPAPEIGALTAHIVRTIGRLSFFGRRSKWGCQRA